MNPYADSTDRSGADFVLFGLGFAAFLLFVAAIIVNSAGLTLAGCLVLLLVIALF
jgi:hypothetical protein